MANRNELHELFIGKFKFREEFSREEVEKFIEPYLDLDPEKTYKQALAKEAQRLIASIKDPDRIRECVGYDLNGQQKFAWPLYTEDVDKLKAMEDRLTKQMRGLENTLERVQTRIWILEHQVTINDILKRKQMSEEQAQLQ
ncbi:MAG: hypothetical protein ACYCX4_02710 [Bacillota bacterium]